MGVSHSSTTLTILAHYGNKRIYVNRDGITIRKEEGYCTVFEYVTWAERVQWLLLLLLNGTLCIDFFLDFCRDIEIYENIQISREIHHSNIKKVVLLSESSKVGINLILIYCYFTIMCCSAAHTFIVCLQHLPSVFDLMICPGMSCR